jgi:hypothetical protein
MFAKRWMSLRQESKREVWMAAADMLGQPHPLDQTSAYATLQEFRRTFAHTPSPHRTTVHRTRRARLASVFAVSRDVNNDAFLASYEWRRLRMVVLKARGARCECCGSSAKDDVVIHVDHIKPRRKYPELALTEANLQVLCEVCNHGKGSWDETDWRAASQLSGYSSRTPKPDPVTATSRPRLVVRGPRPLDELKKAVI